MDSARQLSLCILVALFGLASYQTHTFLQGRTSNSIVILFLIFVLFDCIVIVFLYTLARVFCRL